MTIERQLCSDFELRGKVYEIWEDHLHPSNRCLVDKDTGEIVDTDHSFSPQLTNEELLMIYDYGKDY